MARPKKQGLDYFTNDVNFYQDIKIRKLIRYKGIQAVPVYHYLLCQIYASGYYLEWDEEIPFVVFEATGIEEVTVKDIINYCISIGLFDKTMYDDNKVLTSHGIQERFFAVCAAAKRRLSGDMPYLLVDGKGNEVISEKTRVISEETIVFPEETDDDSEKTPINSAKSTQSKVKKRKDNLDSLDYPRDAREGERETKVTADAGDLKVCASVDEEVADLRNSPIWKEHVFMRFKFLNASDAVLDQYFERWSGECKSKNIKHGTLGEARIHFVNWLIVQEDKSNRNGNSNGADNNNGYRSGEDILNGATGIIARMSTETKRHLSDIPVV